MRSSLFSHYYLFLFAYVTTTSVVSSLVLESGAFVDGELIPMRYTCQGMNIAPPLEWHDIPDGTQSFALVVDDPQHSPHHRTHQHIHHNHNHNHEGNHGNHGNGMGWSHWIVYNIPSNVTSLDMEAAGGKLSCHGAKHGKNDFMQNSHSYNGPCPPNDGTQHLYIFTLYALDLANVEESHGCHNDRMGMKNGMSNEDHKQMMMRGNGGGSDNSMIEMMNNNGQGSSGMSKSMGWMDRDRIESAIQGHILDQATLTGSYEKVDT